MPGHVAQHVAPERNIRRRYLQRSMFHPTEDGMINNSAINSWPPDIHPHCSADAHNATPVPPQSSRQHQFSTSNHTFHRQLLICIL
jgi:hypothetical protein